MSDIDFNAFNEGIVDEFRANHGVVGGPFDGAPMILITHKGAKSGVERTSPLVYTRDGDRVVIIASMGGAPTHPAWFHNIKANPRVQVEIGDESYLADAEILTDGPERQRLFDQQAALMPNFKEYQERTDRVIPVIVLTRSERPVAQGATVATRSLAGTGTRWENLVASGPMVAVMST
jgi:deazaflavin-dependent oxidoreductase (nitroreductase family)